MQYRRDLAGNLLEVSGCDTSSISALKAIFANAFTNYDAVNRDLFDIAPGMKLWMESFNRVPWLQSPIT